ncbi:hypothetical protein EYF80_052950 [Liparis tanakae]|uniref:Uncharacterized protein n=1 Tax=Liparis tanakae TaxID=230148 RepID=A0A4Z2F7U8_9TELE|nr:hypothetical protein EYF80_052950 [Liparis tanakae]
MQTQYLKVTTGGGAVVCSGRRSSLEATGDAARPPAGPTPRDGPEGVPMPGGGASERPLEMDPRASRCQEAGLLNDP